MQIFINGTFVEVWPEEIKLLAQGGDLEEKEPEDDDIETFEVPEEEEPEEEEEVPVEEEF